jgi:hypothetical protein
MWSRFTSDWKWDILFGGLLRAFVTPGIGRVLVFGVSV